jgi:hypothetical protein
MADMGDHQQELVLQQNITQNPAKKMTRLG